MTLRDQLATAGLGEQASDEANRIATSLAALLARVPTPQTMAVVGYIVAEGLRQTHERSGETHPPIDPQIVEWATQGIDLQEAAANLREIRATGGLRLTDFDADLERLAQG